MLQTLEWSSEEACKRIEVWPRR